MLVDLVSVFTTHANAISRIRACVGMIDSDTLKYMCHCGCSCLTDETMLDGIGSLTSLKIRFAQINYFSNLTWWKQIRWINGVIHINFWLIVLIYCANRIVFLLLWPQSLMSFVTTVMTLSSIFSFLGFLLLFQCCLCKNL